MRMMAKSKLVLALLGIVFLLSNPAGVCAGTPATHAPSHPCCPRPSSDSGSCVCIDRQPAAPVLPSLADAGLYAPVAVSAATASLNLQSCEKAEPPDRVPLASEDRFITLHQILV